MGENDRRVTTKFQFSTYSGYGGRSRYREFDWRVRDLKWCYQGIR